MNTETILHNARLVLPDRVIEGILVVEGDLIRQIDEGPYSGMNGIDCERDYLIPGLIEMHTDNLEKNIVPRPGVYWPSALASIIAHDHQMFTSGITTVLDSICVGYFDSAEIRSRMLDQSIEASRSAREKGLFRAEHFLHLRCELPSTIVMDAFETYVSDPYLKLVSVMDHTPGQRQWRDLSKWRLFHTGENWTEKEAMAELNRKQNLQETYALKNREQIVGICNQAGIPTASHDDTTPEQCEEAAESGILISEFPTTIQAAETAHRLGMKTIMGAPNMVRGQSHSGNVSADDLASRNLLDGFSSDFVPISLLHAAFELNRRLKIPLHKALATVTRNIAEMISFQDRGALESGKKADLVRVGCVDDLPVVKTVWKDGRQLMSIVN